MLETAEKTKPNNTSGGEDTRFSAPAITLPKGGGAINGVGEKFGANPVTGTGSMTVPIPASPGRSGVGPQLSLTYDSGAGNGPFGFGWSLSLPAITRKTDKGLPQYQDDEESDVYILSGAEDLVPVLEMAGKEWHRAPAKPRTVTGVDYWVQQYRPRIEGLFARIERWTDRATGQSHWRSISKDNITTLYGKRPGSRIADPADGARTFSWLICESFDDKGNAIFYEYKPEDSDGVDRFTLAHERNRTLLSRSTNRYLKRIKYGNRSPRQPDEDLSLRTDWLFEMVFDYGEHYTENALRQPTAVYLDDQHRSWPVRQDPFSSYRSAFENRTYRLCRRALMFHHFPAELRTEDCLVRATEFHYQETSVASFITSVTQSNFVRRPDGSYFKKSLPPVDFEYSQVTLSNQVQEIDPDSLENLPGLDGSLYQWVDLDGEGVSGILSEQGNAWYYKSSLGEGRFGPVQIVARRPSLAALHSGRQQLLDLTGDGQLDLADFQGPTPGYFERTKDQDWQPFTPFRSLPNVAWNDPNLKFIDLTGDGHADVLITENDAFSWYTSLAADGFGAGEKAIQFFDEEEGPRLVFADGTQSIYLADMSGDGLSDIVRVRNGEVCYWPNLGYSRFGAKVTFDNSPEFDMPDQFDQRRIQLADIDGSGNVDIIYLGREGVSLYFNQSGNRWSDAETLYAFPAIDILAAVTVSDLLGNGTACLVWSSPLPGDAGLPIRYIDLMGGQKPHLLISTKNNLGAETHVQYAASTKFYLADKAAGTPWITRVPFPVHVIERVDTHDRISRNRFVSRYAYHHGNFDGVEREFRGFALVEQWDTEELGALSDTGQFPNATNLDAASYVPPVYTKTWFHTGAYFAGGRISRQFEHEYYREGDASHNEPGLTDAQLEAMLLADTVLPDRIWFADGKRSTYILSAEEAREACRALKGSILRQEVYGLDRADANGQPRDESGRPYSVSERNYTIEILQPQDPNRHGVFLAHARETIDFHYERKLYDVGGRRLADPRVSHALILDVDPYGNVLKSVAIGYGRRRADAGLPAPDQKKQTTSLLTYTENEFTNPILLNEDVYRTPLPCESRTYELLNLAPTSNQALVTSLFRFEDLFSFEPNHPGQTQLASAKPALPYEDVQGVGAKDGKPWRRLIEHVRTLYRADDLTGPLPLGEVKPMALPFESHKLAFTPGLLTQVFGARVTVPMLSGEGGYIHSQGDPTWWIPSGQVFYSPNQNDTAAQELAFAQQHFYMPQRFRDPFGNSATVHYDGYDLLVQQTTDPLGNTVSAEHDYRLLAPFRMTDPNGNRAEVAFDVLGMVAGTAVMGKGTENLGDSLAAFVADLDQGQIDGFFGDPLGPPANALLAGASTRIVYDVDRFHRLGDVAKPVYAATLARETHLNDPLPPQRLKIQVSFSYSDGFGREMQKKIQAEPGPVPPGSAMVNPRWVGSGWTIFNNKGKPVQQYEPFFDDIHEFRFGNLVGVSSTLFYDPVERVVATLHPNHTYEKVVFDPWRQESWDVNDTVQQADPTLDSDVADFFRRVPAGDYLPTWYTQRIAGGLGTDEQQAAIKAAAHGGTPAVAHFDTLGRTFLTIADNGPAGKYETRVEMDIEGNQRTVIDAKGRIVMLYDYDVLGQRIHQSSMEAGERWTLNDVSGKPIRAWDTRGHVLQTEYDELRRPVRSFVQGTDAKNSDPRTLVAQPLLFLKTEYGETLLSAAAGLNLRTRVFRQSDGAGQVTHMATNPVTKENEAYDFKGNLLRSKRVMAQEYHKVLDWSVNHVLEPEEFTTSSTFDALNRALTLTAPDGSIIQPTYNEANLLEKLEVTLKGAATPRSFVTNIDYNAKGQRELIEYGNHVRTEYEYDPRTFRLVHLYTSRRAADFPNDDPNPPNPPRGVQNLRYTYDPIGNIRTIRDDAQQTVYFNNQVVSPRGDYVYDALYRLVESAGREHIGSLAAPQTDWDDQFRVHLPHPQDGKAMRGYTERYIYDEVGNFQHLIHKAQNGDWTRDYNYTEHSLIEPGNLSNRLSGTVVSPNAVQKIVESYTYDAHGSMTTMPHLAAMVWDFKDQFQSADLGGGGGVYYVYDAAGQRVRKIIEDHGGTKQKERLYLGGYEVYREYGSASGVPLERETLHVMDDKQRIALVETRTDILDQVVRYQFGNHLGSASLELDDIGQVITYEEYYPYGSTSYQAGRSAAEVSLKRYRYTGKERDEETGLYYHGARYYAPWLGTWTSCDPSRMIDGVALYQHTRDNPIRFFDPNGRECLELLPGGIGCEREGPEGAKQLPPVPEPATEPKQSKEPVPDPKPGPDPKPSLPVPPPKVEPPRVREDPPPRTDPETESPSGPSWADKVKGAVSTLVGAAKVAASAAVGAAIVFAGGGTAVVAGGGLSTGVGAGVLGTGAISSLPTYPVAPAPAVSLPQPSPPQAAAPSVSLQSPPAPSTPSSTLVGTDIDKFRRDAQRIIAQTKNHPLKFLLDNNTNEFRRTRGLKHSELASRPDLVQMGHILSDKMGGQEIVLQGAWENQLSNVAVEHTRNKGSFVAKNLAIDIGGIGVERETALLWERENLIPKGTVASAKRLNF